MPLQYTEEHEIFRKSIRKFLDNEVNPHIFEWKEQEKIPREIWKKMGEQGFIGFWVEPEYGGSGLDFSFSVVMMEEMNSSSRDLSLCLGVHNDIAMPYIAHSGTEEQKKKYLPKACSGESIMSIAMTEPGAGSDLANIRATAVKDGNEWVINGQKTFISNGYNCDVTIVAVKTDTKVQPAWKGVSLIIVEDGTPGFTKGRKLEKMGVNAADTAELSFEDCRVPLENILGKEGGGFKVLMRNLQQERLVGAFGAILMAEHILGMTVEYATTREAFGRPIASFQANAFRLAELATEIQMAKTFTYKIIDDHLDGKDIEKEVSMAKWYNSELVNRMAYYGVQLHGGYGYMLEYPIAHAYLDVRLQTIAAGTTEIMKTIIARRMGLMK